MKLYRYSTKQWAEAFDGAGAKLYGGRYNPEGVAVVYCCFNPSLPYLECLAANLKHSIWPKYYLTHFQLEDLTLDVTEKSIENLPPEWDNVRHQATVQKWGAKELARRDVIILPSRVNQLDFTVLLNPTRPEFEDSINIIEVREMVFDHRLFGH